MSAPAVVPPSKAELSTRRFGTPLREMVGVHQRARGDAPARARFLLCRPLGQEAVRTAAIYRVLADQLAREGCDSLRFDYHGTGDSPGEEAEQSMAGWVDDVLAAHVHLSPQDGTPVHWFGMGLGATLAARAVQRARQPPRHLVLWEPVFDGSAYAQALLAGHRAELSREFDEPWERLLRTGKVTEPTLPGDVLGFGIGPRLADELKQIHDATPAPALRRGVKVTCALHPEQRPALAALETSPLLKLHMIETRIDWLSSQAQGTAIVPPDLPRTLLASLA